MKKKTDARKIPRKLLRLDLFVDEAEFVLECLKDGGLSLKSIQSGGSKFISNLNKRLSDFVKD